MIEYKVLIDGVDVTEYLALPTKEQYVLDSALDNGVLTLPNTTISTIYKPYTPISFVKNGKAVNMYIVSDKVTKIVGTGNYTHDLVLIEETKLLEKKIVDTNTTTQPKVHDYEDLQAPVYVASTRGSTAHPVVVDGPDYYYNTKFNRLVSLTTTTLPSVAEILGQDTYSDTTITHILTQVGVQKYVSITLKDSGGNTIQQFSGDATTELATKFVLNQPLVNNETYSIGYSLRYEKISSLDTSYNFVSNVFDFIAYQQELLRSDKSITYVVNRLLAITDTLRTNETPALVFNQEQAEFYNQAKETWLINDSPNVTGSLDFDIKFISNGTEYTNISTHSANLYYDNTSMYFAIGDGWRDDAYKTIQFLERPKGSLLTWLQANATKQSEELYHPAPEFSMTKSTLRECLDQVGGYIHSIVRLVGNTIYFDKLGGTKETTLDEDYIGYYETLDSEQYASQLDTIVSNLTNIDDANTGTINEPFLFGFKTVRAESVAVRINDESAIIETDYPIEKIHKLYCGWITPTDSQEAIYVGDITPYVYEKAEYDLLSSVSGTFPMSKGYAITYTQGEKNITGLTFKLPNPVSPIFENQAILNIISQKTGRSVQNLLSVQNIANLQFWLVYYPSTTARVEQTRSDITNYSMELTSIYNQSANKVDSRAYGENLKGTIARLGNVDKFITFNKHIGRKWTINDEPTISSIDININFTSNNISYSRFRITSNLLGGIIWYDNTPVCTKLGNAWSWADNVYKDIEFNEELTRVLLEWFKANAVDKDILVEVGDFVNIENQDYYIATLDIENQPDYIKYTVGLSKDFNALAKYIGIKNNIRLYEVSEKQSFERYVVRHDYCVVGEPIESDFKDMLTDVSKSGIVEQITSPLTSQKRITAVEAQGVDVDGALLEKINLPVITLGMGNTLWCGFRYADNYSAGNQSIQANDGGAYYKLNAPVRYTDYFGEIETLKLKLLSTIEVINDKATAISVGDALPKETLTPSGYALVDTGNYDLIVKKDNREQINIAYMLHFVTNNDIIIGSELVQGNPMLQSSSPISKLYILPNRLHKFDRDVDLTGAVMVHDYEDDETNITYSSVNNQVTFADMQANANGKSWAIVNGNNKLLFGKNIEIANGDTIEMPTMTYTHKVIKRSGLW